MKLKYTSKLLSVFSLLICCTGRKVTSLKNTPIYALTILFLFLSVTIDTNKGFAQIDKKIQSVNENSISKPKLTKTYNTTGEVEQEWVAIYNGVGSLRSDEATDLAVDSYGNVYVTGYSQGLSYDYDCATIKYDSHGEVLWINRYDGGFDDYAYKLALDDSANVYITGSSYSTDSDEDYLTIKYSTDGVEQWVRKYDGPGNGYDRAADIATDNFGNIYVTGSSSGSGTERDFATIKYDSDGIEQWVKRYNGPQNSYDYAVAITTDNFRNVIVTGRSSLDFATLKYNLTGDELWVRRFTRLGNYPDWPYDITVDNSGNVLVTGTGSSLDSTSFAPDYLTIKYDSTGALLWNSRYNGPGNDFDEARVVAVDDTGNIFITGWSLAEGGRNDYATIKYDPSGTEQWVSRFIGGFAHDLAIDALGNVYVAGVSFDSTTLGASTTIKYDTYGLQQWFIRYYGPGGDDAAQAIALDESGNVYVTGITYVPGGIPTFDYATIKYKQKIVPVEFTNFTASVTNNHIMLDWETATEMNNQGFEIERKVGSGQSTVGNLSDGEAGWETIGFVPGFGTTAEPKSYSFTDENVSLGNYKYRLKQIDFDGSFEYSNIIEVLFGNPITFSLEQNFPNPFNATTSINYSIAEPSNVVLLVYNSLGEEVAVLINEKKEVGNYSLWFNAQGLSSGVYLYRLNAYGTTGEYSFVKKFILLK